MRTLLLLVLFLYSLPTFAQSPPAVISVDKVNRVLYAGVDNPLTIVAQQEEPVGLGQISAIADYPNESKSIKVLPNRGYFTIRPEQLGNISITVETKIGKVEYYYNVHLIPVEVRIGRYTSTHKTAQLNAIKAQIGIRASLRKLDLNGTAPVTTYGITTITNGTVRRHINQGGPFDETGRAMINDLQIGDTLIIRDVHVRRPGFEGTLPLPDTLVLTIE